MIARCESIYISLVDNLDEALHFLSCKCADALPVFLPMILFSNVCVALRVDHDHGGPHHGEFLAQLFVLDAVNSTYSNDAKHLLCQHIVFVLHVLTLLFVTLEEEDCPNLASSVETRQRVQAQDAHV